MFKCLCAFALALRAAKRGGNAGKKSKGKQEKKKRNPQSPPRYFLFYKKVFGMVHGLWFVVCGFFLIALAVNCSCKLKPRTKAPALRLVLAEQVVEAVGRLCMVYRAVAEATATNNQHLHPYNEQINQR
jgi:hypothetical protein